MAFAMSADNDKPYLNKHLMKSIKDVLDANLHAYNVRLYRYYVKDEEGKDAIGFSYLVYLEFPLVYMPDGWHDAILETKPDQPELRLMPKVFKRLAEDGIPAECEEYFYVDVLTKSVDGKEGGVALFLEMDEARSEMQKDANLYKEEAKKENDKMRGVETSQEWSKMGQELGKANTNPTPSISTYTVPKSERPNYSRSSSLLDQQVGRIHGIFSPDEYEAMHTLMLTLGRVLHHVEIHFPPGNQYQYGGPEQDPLPGGSGEQQKLWCQVDKGNHNQQSEREGNRLWQGNIESGGKGPKATSHDKRTTMDLDDKPVEYCHDKEA